MVKAIVDNKDGLPMSL